MKQISVLILLIGLISVLPACTPNQSASSDQSSIKVEQTIEQPSSTPYPTYTFQPTYTPFPTSTSLPVFTPTSSATPTDTSTPTSTSIPFDLADCVNFSFPIGTEADQDIIRTKLTPLIGKCVRFYYSNDEFLGTYTDYVMGDDLVYSAHVTVISDDATPAGTVKPKVFGIIWAIVETPPDKENIHILHLRKSFEFPQNQLPLDDEGLYLVGKENDMYPGTWKSGVAPTRTSDCYWAIINTTTGEIKDNYIGIGGITVNVSEGDTLKQMSIVQIGFILAPEIVIIWRIGLALDS